MSDPSSLPGALVVFFEADVRGPLVIHSALDFFLMLR